MLTYSFTDAEATICGFTQKPSQIKESPSSISNQPRGAPRQRTFFKPQTSKTKTVNNQTPSPNQFKAINWSNYSQASSQGPIVETFQSALMDCEHTHEFGAEAQSWAEYSEIIEINAAGDIVNSTYFVTL